MVTHTPRDHSHSVLILLLHFEFLTLDGAAEYYGRVMTLGSIGLLAYLVHRTLVGARPATAGRLLEGATARA